MFKTELEKMRRIKSFHLNLYQSQGALEDHQGQVQHHQQSHLHKGKSIKDIIDWINDRSLIYWKETHKQISGKNLGAWGKGS